MKYYRVPAAMADRPCYKPSKPGFPRIPNGYYLIGNELLTPAECRKINAPVERLTPVEIKKTETFRMFGARFAADTERR